jgi:type IV pilus assembly protein PilA
MRKYGTQRGFTIIEIMGVVAIIGVLLVLVLPSVKANAVRTKMAEVILAFGPCKAMVTDVYLSGGDPPGADQWGCEIASNATTYVDSVHTSPEGVISVVLHGFGDGRLDVHTLTLAPLDGTGNLTSGGSVARWRCGSPVDNTDVPVQYLPASCRGG